MKGRSPHSSRQKATTCAHSLPILEEVSPLRVSFPGCVLSSDTSHSPTVSNSMASRQRNTSGEPSPSAPFAQHEALQAARKLQHAPAFARQYRLREGIEATISEARASLWHAPLPLYWRSKK